MILQQWWILAVGWSLICVSNQSSPQKRQCMYQVSPREIDYTSAGNVSGSVQLCERTQCCVGYYIINATTGQPKVDVLACGIVEKTCPDATCKAKIRNAGLTMVCACNTDLCNRNITWNPESEESQLTYSYSGDDMTTAVILVGTLLALCFIIIVFILLKEKKQNLPSLDEYGSSGLCFCQTTKPSEIDVANLELQQIVGHGKFATVWQGKYKESVVAVKVFPAGWRHKFTEEKEIYELPLMKHAGIVPFLGTGTKPEDSSCLIVLHYAERGSLHSFLCENTTDWMSSLKLCQSLSQGLSYLHSDIRRYDVHKPPVAHRDLSSSNVLVRADGTCVLCDFGSSTILASFSEHCHSAIMLGQTQEGTLRYMSPEILEGSVNLNNSGCLMQGDIYALALLLWEICMCCSDLFDGSIVPQHLLPYESELGPNITKERLTLYVCHTDKRPSIPRHWKLLPQGSVLQETLTDCWDYEPDARLTAHCVADRLLSLQSCNQHLHCSLSVTTV